MILLVKYGILTYMIKFLKKLFVTVSVSLAVIGSILWIAPIAPAYATFYTVQAPRFYLAGSGVGTTDTSITLVSMTLPDLSTTISMTNFGSIGYATLEPSTSKEEQISFTGITQNVNGTATLTGVTRGLNFVYPYTSVSAYKKSHAGGASLVLSNTSGFYSQFPAKDNNETITGQWTFNSFPLTASTTYASPTVIGWTKLSTTAASTTNPIAVGDNDPRVPTLTQAQALVGASSTPSSSNPYADKAYVDYKVPVIFGGTGSDGALIATSSTITIDLGSSTVVTKNYTSVSITGTGAIAFTNAAASGTLVNFLVQGDFTATSSTSTAIDLRNLGAPGGIGGTHNTTSTATAGGEWQLTNVLLSGTAGGGAITTTPGTLAATSSPFYNAYSLFRAVPGNGGGGGGGSGDGGAVSGGNGGAGGRGAGALYIQVGGNFNASANINMSGTNGTVGGDSGSWGGCSQGPNPGAGGGGGAGGSFVADVAGTITNTMVFTLSGGTGGGPGNVIGSGVTGCGINSAYGSGGGGSPSLYSTGNGGTLGAGGTGASGYWIINKRPTLTY